MKLLFSLLSLFIIVNAEASNHTLIHSEETCTPESGTYVVLTNEQLEELSNCSVLDGNLFIHGGLELTDEDLLPLSNLRAIHGYLVIWNSQNIHCLMGLYNLENILGNNLYLDQYALYVKDNFRDSHIHNGNETRNGLCYVDTVNWDIILNNNYLISDNGENCPSCHIECDGCFSEGPRYCQNCVHYKSGNTCVDVCPIGTTIQNLTCIESVPSKPTDLNLTVLSKSSILTQWGEPNPPNGVIFGYELYRNGTLVFNESLEDYDFNHTDSSLSLSNICSRLAPNTVYAYRLRAYSSVGYSAFSDEVMVKTFEDVPPQPLPPVVTIVDANTINVSWAHLDNISGTFLYYEFELYIDGEYLVNFNETDHIHHITIENLAHNTSYSIRMRAYSNAGPGEFSHFTYFSTPLGIPSVPQNLVGHSYSSSTIHLSWEEPLDTNGILTNYSYEVYNNNTLYIHEFTDLNTEVNITRLETYTNYDFRINAYTRNGPGDFTSFLTLRTDVGVPPEPATPILRLVNNSLEVSLSTESDVNGPIILYRLYLLDLNTNIESNVYENNSLSGNPIHLDLVLDYDTSYSSRLEVYTSNEYYSESNYSNIVTTESEPTTTTQTPTTQTPTTTTTTQTPTTTTTIQTSTTPTTGNPTDSPNNRDQSKSDDKFLSEEIIEMLIYVAGTLGGLLLVILMCIRYIKKKKVGNVDNNRPINNTTVYSNPLYDDGRNSGDTNNTINRSNRDITGYIEVEETPIYSSDHTEDETDLDNRIITDIYSEVNRAGLVPKNMMNDDLDTQL